MLMILSIFVFLGALFIFFQWYYGTKNLAILDNYPRHLPSSTPFISVIVAAKNEEKEIYKSIHSLLDQHYPSYEVIVTNDRSTDETLTFLKQLKETHRNRKKLTITTIHSLPHGWLGKNHALYEGTKLAKGEWLLFADGDVIFSKETLTKSVHCVTKNKLDHLTIIPENIGGSLAYRAFHSYWSILGVWNFIQLKHAGVGAYNMLRSSVYEKIGTHRSLAMVPDDDLKLGKRVVQTGYRQQLGFGKNLIRIQWYKNIPQVITGLEKNLFAFMRYSVFLVMLFSILLFMFHVLPFIGITSSDLLTRVFFLATIFIYATMYWYNKKFVKDSPWFFLFMPLNGLLFILCLCRSAFVTIKNGRIEWRGTHYSLKELRQQMKNQ
ncbi:glycosyltransferase [Salipaludibacillus daqingensis]|uniref:glycosyltransferase n=1 Tax=Salipaludibacillus daqingensis TaxID=3041001 RepID=UPI002473D8CA|nr:glycosyltransferase family A protein [Salipaludibacillus daqingensis]